MLRQSRSPTAGLLIASAVVMSVIMGSQCLSTTTTTTTISPVPNPATLVITDKALAPTINQTHSIFFKTLQDRGYQLTFRSSDDSTVRLSKYGEFLYDNIILFCPTTERFRATNVDLKELLNFIDQGHNVLLVGGNAPGTIIQELAREIGFEFKKTSAKRDYSNTRLRDIYHIIGARDGYPATPAFVYLGAQLRMANHELTMGILSNNAPVDDTTNGSTERKSTSNILIGATQARNNARVVVSGSLDFFSDKSYKESSNQNTKLTDQLTAWTFKEKSVLRYSAVTHNKAPNDGAPIKTATDLQARQQQQQNDEGYTIMDDILYTIKIDIFENGRWAPYKADDVQLEFVRIDPFVRQTMRIVDDKYLAEFKVPDVYGVYKFQVDYKREGLTYLFSSTQVSVRPLKHTEYERYLYSAYPYYLSAFLMMAYLYLFSFVFLYFKDQATQSTKSKSE